MNIAWAAVLTTCQGGELADEALVDKTIDLLGELGLSAEAQNTMRGIRNLTARTQSVAARLALVRALAQESGVYAFDQSLPLTWKEKKPLSGLGYDALGAPCLSDGTATISLAHCDGMAVAACADRNVRIGVDAERIDRPLARRDDIAKRFFSPAEWALWENNGRQMIDFLRIWTRKEALGKARGTGLRADVTALDTLTVSSEHFSEHMIGEIMITLCVIE